MGGRHAILNEGAILEKIQADISLGRGSKAL